MDLPAHLPPHLGELTHKFIRDDSHTKEEISEMIREYLNLERRIISIKIQGDHENEWWEPDVVQFQAIHCLIFEVIAPYNARAFNTFYQEERYGWR